MRVGDLPERLASRYLIEAGVLGPAKVYVDATSKEPAFTDAGARLSSERNNPNTIGDLITIAEHRGWSSITVRGSADFKREAWLQARVAGLEVDGFKPRPRDLQALEHRLAPHERSTPKSSNEGPMLSDIVEGKLLAKGFAPHCNRAGAPPSAFVRLRQDNGEVVELWSPDLRNVLARVDPGVGEHMTLLRQGNDFTQVRNPARDATVAGVKESAPTLTPAERRAERFRSLDAAARARDPDLRTAQEHLSLLTAVVKRQLPPSPTRDTLTTQLGGLIADRLAAGVNFEAVRVRGADRATLPERLQTEPAHKTRGPERTRAR